MHDSPRQPIQNKMDAIVLFMGKPFGRDAIRRGRFGLENKINNYSILLLLHIMPIACDNNIYRYIHCIMYSNMHKFNI